MTRSSGLIGCPPRLRPFASRLGPCRISASHSQSQQLLTSVCSLLELNLSLRVPSSFALSVPCSPTKVARSSQTPLLRSLPLQRSQAEATGGLALSCPSAATFHSHSVPPSPFLTTSTVCSARSFAGLLHPATNHGVHPVSDFPLPLRTTSQSRPTSTFKIRPKSSSSGARATRFLVFVRKRITSSRMVSKKQD